MKCIMSYEITKANSVNGYGVSVVRTYTSHDKKKIDSICDYLKDTLKDGVIFEISDEFECEVSK